MQTQGLEFKLTSNHLINNGRYMAKVVNQKSIDFENLLLETEHDTALRKEDIRLAITHFMDAIGGNLVRGLKVETPLGVFRASVRGSFSSPVDDFRPSADTTNHEVKLMFRPSKSFVEKVVSGIVIEKVLDNPVQYPKVFEFRNLNAAEDGTCKPFHLLSLTGVNLKIDAAKEDEGAFWSDKEGAVTKTSVIGHNTNTALEFQVPDLAPGIYSISIATRLGNHKLRSSTLDQQVTIG